MKSTRKKTSEKSNYESQEWSEKSIDYNFGESKINREYEYLIGGNYIIGRNRSTYEEQEINPEGPPSFSAGREWPAEETPFHLRGVLRANRKKAFCPAGRSLPVFQAPCEPDDKYPASSNLPRHLRSDPARYPRHHRWLIVHPHPAIFL